MKTVKKDSYTLLQTNTEDITEFASIVTRNYHDYDEENLVVDLSTFTTDTKNILAFLEFSRMHREAKKSLVLVAKNVSIEEIPEDLVVAPTIQEAEDLIQMDEIQRDLGF